MRARLLILLAAALVTAAPLLILLLPGARGLPLGLLALTAVLIVAVVLLRWSRPLADLEALGGHLDGLIRGEAGEAPRFGRLLRRLGLAAAVRRFLEHWQRQQQEAAGRYGRAEAVLEGLPDPLITLDAERRIARLNAAARALLGARSEGRELTQLLRQPELYEAIDSVAGGGEASIEIRQPGPVERDFLCHVSRGVASGAEAGEILVLLRDVTEVRRSTEMRVDFVANASHEIRTPLATIVGCIETLQGPARDDPEAIDRFLAIMRQQSERMSRLVEDLLSLSRIELNEHQPPRGRVAIAELLQQVLDELTLSAQGAGVALGLQLEDDLPSVSGDTEELEQVFHNLIDNAIKYGSAGDRVEVSARHVGAGAFGPAVAVAVRDFGPGIAAEHRPRLTERFYRVDKARSRELGGTGLGLAIVKHIVNRHRGVLEIESELGEGSTFTVRLPVEPASQS